jgi:hypothetical protein
MVCRAATMFLLTAILAAPAHAAQSIELMPGVGYEQTVEFTPHGAVALHVITAPRPGDQNGLYRLAPVLAHGTVLGGRERVTQIEQDVSAEATVAGINGDFAGARDGSPAGIVLTDGVLAHPPLGSRSSIGIDSAGTLHVDRVKFFGTWKGTGQRRPLNGVNTRPAPGQVVLFTPAYGAPVPAIPGAAEAILQAFPAPSANADLAATVTAVGVNGGEPIPAGGAILQASGSLAAKLQAEAPAGTAVAMRAILQPAWTGVTEALGGGPVLVRNGKPVFRSLEDFTNDQVTARDPRSAVGQLADGRVILVAVDGRQPGYSVGLTAFELAQTLVRLGAVTAAGLEGGDSVTAAFDGRLLNRPSAATGERPVREALLVEYAGVYAPEPPLPLVTGEPGRTDEPLSYKLVRPSLVTAELVGPDGEARVLEAGAQHDPGSYSFAASALDAEGTWHWRVTATDDLKRTSTIDRTFRYDTTLRAVTVPRVARGSATVGFTLSRPASAKLRIETRDGVVLRTLAAPNLQPGARMLRWDGRLALGTRAYAGTYVAHVFATSSVGVADVAVQFSFSRSR